MPRKPRIEYEDAIYHVMNRGNYRDDIFLVKDSDAVFQGRYKALLIERNQWLSDHLHMGSIYTISRVVARENRRPKGRNKLWRKLLTAKR